MKTIATILLAASAIGCAVPGPSIQGSRYEVATADTATDTGDLWAGECEVPAFEVCTQGAAFVFLADYALDTSGAGCEMTQGVRLYDGANLISAATFGQLFQVDQTHTGAGVLYWAWVPATDAEEAQASTAELVWHNYTTGGWVHVADLSKDIEPCDFGLN